ncbi:non-heme iron oxygenase ferredoxin subunit, partial [Chloroflexus sp. MS-G]|uniref:non-heme iron oxygenase ferredoxin subunit n=2 Tax=unclassified Chloroflexus TaxID=2633855 RepID=UPI001F44C3D0
DTAKKYLAESHCFETAQEYTMQLIEVCSLDDVPVGSGRAFTVGDRRIAIFRVSETDIYALDDLCSHDEASLSEGELDSESLCVECPMHGSLFDLRTGQPKTLPAFAPVATYRTVVRDERVFVEFSD